MSLKDDEGAKIAGLFKNPSSVQSSGIVVNGVRYQVLKADDRSIYGKSGSNGVVAAKTNQLIIVSIYTSGMQAGNANAVVEKLADYIRGQGY